MQLELTAEVRGKRFLKYPWDHAEQGAGDRSHGGPAQASEGLAGFPSKARSTI